MKRVLLLMIGGAVALLVGPAADAATTSGKVVVTDATINAITIETADGKRFVFTRNDATKIEGTGGDVALADIGRDSRVTVTSAQPPTDPLLPLLATRMHVDEMVAAPALASEPAGTARVDSAGKDGGLPIHTAEVQSADAAATTEHPATRLPLIVAVVAGSLIAGLALMLRRG